MLAYLARLVGMEQASIRPTSVPSLTQARYEEARRNAIVLAAGVYVAVRGSAFALERLAAGARFLQRGMESAAKAMAEEAARRKPSQT